MEHASVTSALQCLLAAERFDVLPEAQIERIKIDGPILIRRFLDVGEGQMTNAIAQYGYIHDRSTLSHVSGE